MLRIGQKFFDERECRFLTINGVGADPKVYSCIQEELVPADRLYDAEADAEFQITDIVQMHEGELMRMEVIA